MWDAGGGAHHWVGRTGSLPRHHREDARENGTLLLRTCYFLGALPHFDFFVGMIGLSKLAIVVKIVLPFKIAFISSGVTIDGAIKINVRGC